VTDHFKNQGRTLLANGYQIIPIRRGEKRPAIDGWQKSRLGMADLQRYPDHGVGVLCGQGAHPIVGVDVDISHPDIGPAVIDWCQRHLGYGGERVGAAPRILLTYLAAEAGWAKGNSVMFFDPTDPLKPNGKENKQQVEILGLGQQFVAYHEHPDTLQDYEWVDMMGGLEYIAAGDLPVITSDQIEALLAEVLRLVRATPGVEVSGRSDLALYRRSTESAFDDLTALVPRTDTPFAEMVELVKYLQNDGDDYDTWFHVGAALHHEYAGTEHEGAALALWREYGSRSPKDDPSNYDYKWRSFAKSSVAPTTARWLLKVANQAKRDATSVALRESVDTIKALIKGERDELKLAGETARKIKDMLPDDVILQTQAVALFQAQWKALTGTAMPVVQARSLLVGPRHATVQSKRPLTEFGNAERMLDRFADGLMFVPETKNWYLWTGVYWRSAVDVEIEHLAKETIKSLPREAQDHQDAGEFFQFCALSQQMRMVTNMVKIAASDPRVAVPARELDKISHLMGVQNGVVDLRTGHLIPSDPNYRITLVAGCDFVATAKCPLFTSTLHEVFSGDTDLVDYVLNAFGYAAMGDPTQDVMFIPFGNGSNGKSTVLGMVRKAFGTYARAADAGTFVSDSGSANAGGPREDLVRLRGSRFVYVNEPDENSELREGTVKSMTGGDEITARTLYAKSSVEITPTWTVFMPTNHKPIVKGSDNGIWRRLKLIPFERNFEADKTIVKDPKRVEKLQAELPGILALIVRSAVRYQRDGLVEPGSVRAARDSYRTQMDLLAEWLEDCCEIGEGKMEESNRLWLSWEQFAKNRGILNYVKSSVALGRRLDSRFTASKGTGGVRIRLGIGLKSEFANQIDPIVAGSGGLDLFS